MSCLHSGRVGQQRADDPACSLDSIRVKILAGIDVADARTPSSFVRQCGGPLQPETQDEHVIGLGKVREHSRISSGENKPVIKRQARAMLAVRSYRRHGIFDGEHAPSFIRLGTTFIRMYGSLKKISRR